MAEHDMYHNPSNHRLRSVDSLSTMKQIVSFCLLLWLTICPFWEAAVCTTTCEEPPDLDTLKETLGNYAVHESRYLDPSNYNNNNRLNIHTAGHQRGLAEMRREASCPSHRRGPYMGPNQVHERSLCPWGYVTHSDPNRIPETITEVSCRCHRCLLHNMDGTRDDTKRCKPVYYHIRALRRSPNCTVTQSGSRYYQYYRVLEPVKVACSCVRPLLGESSSVLSNGPHSTP